MPWTRDVLIDRIRHVANAEDATGDWPADVVLDEASLVHAQEWGHLLDMNPRLRMARRVCTVGTDGTIPLTALSTTTERFDRVVVLVDGTVSLLSLIESMEPRVGRSRDTLGTSLVRWQRIGNQVVVDRDTGGTVTALVTHTPVLVRDLPLPPQPATGTLEPTIEFPDGWELLLAYETAAHLLHKGARESDAAGILEQKAEQLRQRLLARIGRDRTAPLTVTAIDSASEWGG